MYYTIYSELWRYFIPYFGNILLRTMALFYSELGFTIGGLIVLFFVREKSNNNKSGSGMSKQVIFVFTQNHEKL